MNLEATRTGGEMYNGGFWPNSENLPNLNWVFFFFFFFWELEDIDGGSNSSEFRSRWNLIFFYKNSRIFFLGSGELWFVGLDQRFCFGFGGRFELLGFDLFFLFPSAICFHCFWKSRYWVFAIELRVGIDQPSFFFFQKILLVSLLVRIYLYQFWERIAGLVEEKRLIGSCWGVLPLRSAERTSGVLECEGLFYFGDERRSGVCRSTMTGGSLGLRSGSYGSLQHLQNGSFHPQPQYVVRKPSKMLPSGSREKEKIFPFRCRVLCSTRAGMLILVIFASLVFLSGFSTVNKGLFPSHMHSFLLLLL